MPKDSQIFLINVCLNDLKSGEEEKVKYAFSQLKKLASEYVVKKLIEFLKDENWFIRKRAANLLVEIGELATPYLTEAVKSENDDVRFWAIESLARLSQFEPVNQALESPDSDTRMYAIMALSKHPSLESVKALINRFGDSQWSIRKQAADVVANIGEEAVPFLKEAFINNLTGGDENICYWAIKTLVRILKEDALPPLVKALKSSNKNMKYYAVVAMSELKSELVINPLVEALKDESWIVRKQAADSLINIGKSVIPYLTKNFARGTADQKFWSIQILAKIMGASAVPLFVKLLKSADEDMRYYTITALGEIDDKNTIFPLIEALGDKAWLIRKQAAEMLIKKGKVVIPYVGDQLESENEDIKFWSITILGRAFEEGIPYLIDLLKRSDTKTKRFIISALSDVRSDKVIRPLIMCLTDDAWPIRNLAAMNLLERGEKVLMPLLDEIETNDNQDLLYWGAKIINSLGEKIESKILKLLLERNEKIVKFIKENYKHLNSESFVNKALDEFLTSSSPSINLLESVIIANFEKIKNRVLREIETFNETAVKKLTDLLSEVKDESLVPMLIELLKKPYKEETLFSIVQALKHYNFPEIVETFLSLLKAMPLNIQNEILSYLKNIKDENIFLKILDSFLEFSAEIKEQIVSDWYDYFAKIEDYKTICTLLKLGNAQINESLKESIRKIADKDLSIILKSIEADEDIRPFVIPALASVENIAPHFPLFLKLIERDDRLEVQKEIIKLFIKNCNKEVLPVLVNMATANTEFAELITENLKTLPDISMLPLILPLVDSENKRIQEWVLELLKNMGDEVVNYLKNSMEQADVRTKMGVLKLMGILQLEEVVEPLLSALNTTDEELKIEAIKALGRSKSKRAVFPLLELLSKDKLSIKPYIIEALTEIGDVQALSPLLDYMENDSWVIRAKVVEAVGTIKPELGADALISALKDENTIVKRKAAKFLGTIKNEKVVEKIIKLLKEEDLPEFPLIITILKDIGELAIKLLTHHLSNKEWNIRNRATQILQEIGHPVVEPMIKEIDKDNWMQKKHAMKVLEAIGEASKPILAELSKSKASYSKIAEQFLKNLEEKEELGLAKKRPVIDTPPETQ